VATSKANDLSGLVKKKKKEPVQDSASNGGSGKRKAEDAGEESDGKKARVD
jgi:hypothetical protein